MRKSFAGPDSESGRSGKCLLGAVTAAELVDLTCGIHYLLLARIERVAGAANLDAEVTPGGRASLEAVAAAAGDGDLLVVGVDIGFHVVLERSKRNGILGLKGFGCKRLRREDAIRGYLSWLTVTQVAAGSPGAPALWPQA